MTFKKNWLTDLIWAVTAAIIGLNCRIFEVVPDGNAGNGIIKNEWFCSL